eukprot:TRINITY_DN25925_c0_g1_i1.p1 TRINITY_DN25925_c0_g1~~TRINITY_DN25925_c0_g1_i1.p1  ORF type:complete len:507 (+),score=64.52 TRINITY_DN25925_c0_g1_i1:195-1715(+)
MPLNLLSPLKFFPQPRWNPADKGGCWDGKFFPEVCCQPPDGHKACFPEEGREPDTPVTFEACCAEFLSRRPYQVDAPGLDGTSPYPRVDLVIRTWHEDLVLVLTLLRSLAIFWPLAKLRSTVNVVLDSEDAQTNPACSAIEHEFGTWVTCVGEDPPPWNDFSLKRSKAARVHWSTFLSDMYVDPAAEYVGILDSDVVFHSHGAEALMFTRLQARDALSATSSQWQPVIFGRWSATFAFSSLAVQDEFPEATFMDSLPMIIRREDFAALRSHMQARWSGISGQASLSFDQAFVAAAREVEIFSGSYGQWITGNHGEFLCFQAAMGAFLWRWRKTSYHFSIYGGLQRGLPMHATCPSLRPALHATNLKRAADRNRNVSYEQEVNAIMAAGLCATAAAQGGLSAQLARRCRSLPYDSRQLLLRADDLHIGGSDAPTWLATESGHCGARSLPRLLADHWQLLALAEHPSGAVKALLRRMLRSNATGRYSYDPGAKRLSTAQRLEAMGVDA